MKINAHVSVALVVLVAFVSGNYETRAQLPPSAPPALGTPTPTTSPVQPAAPALTAKELDGLDVMGSDGQQVGKVKKVLVDKDKVQAVEVQTGGFLGFFTSTYVIPVDKLTKKGGRIDLSMTSEQAKKLTK